MSYTKEQIRTIRRGMVKGQPITAEQEKMLIRLKLVDGFYEDFPESYKDKIHIINNRIDGILCKMSRKWIANQRNRNHVPQRV